MKKALAVVLVTLATASCDLFSPNQPPATAGSLGTFSLIAGQSTSVDLQAYFTDPDGDVLTYTASVSDPRIALVTVSGTILGVQAQEGGTGTITITATDPDGLTATQGVGITVHWPPVTGDWVGTFFLDGRTWTWRFSLNQAGAAVTGILTVSLSGFTNSLTSSLNGSFTYPNLSVQGSLPTTSGSVAVRYIGQANRSVSQITGNLILGANETYALNLERN